MKTIKKQGRRKFRFYVFRLTQHPGGDTEWKFELVPCNRALI